MLFTTLLISRGVFFIDASIILAVAAAALAAMAVGGWVGATLAGRWSNGLATFRRRIARHMPGAERTLADDLSVAVLDREMFIAHQPKLRARAGTIEGVEVLVRWQHPTRGLIGPNDFISLAEERGEIRRLTEWVVRQTLVEQRLLAEAGHKLAFNINISARLLADRDFAEWALATVAEASGPIGFEITETAMIADPEGALRNLHLFADAGIKIAIDDYGAGLSSLAYLKQLPAHELKIDRMFISSLSSSHRDPLLVRSTIDLAHALDMEVTAEGVDSPASQALLKVMGCDLMQGFLIAKPMRLGELRAYLDVNEGRAPHIPSEFNWIEKTSRSS
jgi:EAL domain-containing protein (putative c-di-GMP-specific phosphodiesterase class I)